MYISDFLIDQSSLILTGVLVAFISHLIYKITPTGFVSAGRYRTKEGAIAIYIFAILVLGLLTPFIYELSGLIIKEVPIISIIGFIIVCSNFIINQSVPTWKHTTPKTLLIYLTGVMLIILGFLLINIKF
ncbi:MAG: hypothetical protein A3K77_06085 [Euryarchaeota archaeon RBG_13_31_8]|nr:MAG: hypothetical protein A3K77_06085 [Euryarchaeota archaeon RBG_13_31_8]